VLVQTNFGGGKTHSMLALYHLFSGTPASELVGIDAVLAEADTKKLPTAKCVVLVGNKISPGNPVKKPDGTTVRTLWGELAWQLGGKKAFDRVRADDEKATSPGDVLRELFNEYGPCLILIDEWVAYARQLHDQSDLPAGGFETQFTFAQVLTESAKLVKNCLLVISLPASDTAGSPQTQADDVEVGGQRGREALDRLRNVVGRVESSCRPASAEEGFDSVTIGTVDISHGPVMLRELLGTNHRVEDLRGGVHLRVKRHRWVSAAARLMTRQGESGPYSQSFESGRARIVIARPEEQSVSRRHALVQPSADGVTPAASPSSSSSTTSDSSVSGSSGGSGSSGSGGGCGTSAAGWGSSCDLSSVICDLSSVICDLAEGAHRRLSRA